MFDKAKNRIALYTAVSDRYIIVNDINFLTLMSEVCCYEDERFYLKVQILMSFTIKTDPLIEAAYYEGDLLTAVLELEPDDWKYNQNELKNFITILRENRSKTEICEDIPNELIKKYINYTFNEVTPL